MPAPEIEVQPLEGNQWRVVVREPSVESAFTVTVPADQEAAGLPTAHPGDLVEASFRFLLDREPASQILEEFSLDEIPRYFPEYPEQVRTYLH